MAEQMKPTPKQIAFLQKLEIKPLATKAQCRRLITFIIESNGAAEGTEEERITLYVSAEEKWVGKKARYFDGREVLVMSVFPKDRFEVRHDREELEKHGSDESPNPFMAGFKYLSQKGSSCCSLGLLTLH